MNIIIHGNADKYLSIFSSDIIGCLTFHSFFYEERKLQFERADGGFERVWDGGLRRYFLASVLRTSEFKKGYIYL